MIRPFFFEHGIFYILDQRRLPDEEVWIRCTSEADVAEAINTLAVRGAPAIGIAAAYGILLAAQAGQDLEAAASTLIKARPTAVNLAWAVNRVLAAVRTCPDRDQLVTMQGEAEAIWEEEIRANRDMAEHGAALFPDGKKYAILTHCNTGSLATGGMGTALGVVRALHARGKLAMAYVDETRPLLQGARLTAYELKQDGIPATLITDSMAGWLMQQGRVDAVMVGADRIARNHDTANKIGTYSLAVLAHAHAIPFYVVAPLSTFDPECPSGDHIPIEERDASEVQGLGEQQIAEDIPVYNPAFDITPHELITAIITESKIFR